MNCNGAVEPVQPIIEVTGIEIRGRCSNAENGGVEGVKMRWSGYWSKPQLQVILVYFCD